MKWVGNPHKVGSLFNFGRAQGLTSPPFNRPQLGAILAGVFCLKGWVLTCSILAAFGNMEDKVSCFKSQRGSRSLLKRLSVLLTSSIVI